MQIGAFRTSGNTLWPNNERATERKRRNYLHVDRPKAATATATANLDCQTMPIFDVQGTFVGMCSIVEAQIAAKSFI